MEANRSGGGSPMIMLRDGLNSRSDLPAMDSRTAERMRAENCLGIVGRLGIQLVVVLLGILSVSNAWGQASWEYSAYESRLWLVTDGSPQLQGIEQQVRDELPAWTESRLLGVWDLKIEEPTINMRARLREGFAQVETADILAIEPKSLLGDKLYLIMLEDLGSGFQVGVREVDCRTRDVGAMLSVTVGHVEMIVPTIESLLLKAFTPITKIESIEDVAVKARLRAGGMIVDPQSPALVEPGQVLVPVLRRDDRNGEPLKNGVQPVAWTTLLVKTRLDSIVVCELTSGFRSPMPTKVGARTSRYAVVAKSQLDSTHVVLRSRGRGQLLAGYEVFSKSNSEAEAKLVGVTDWRGSLEVPSTDGKLQVLIVKNGNQLLARLPLVAGYQAEAFATTIEDDARLEAEGFVQAFQGRIMDLVARREIIASRLRKRIEEKKFDEASKLLEDFRALENRSDLKKSLDVQQQAITSKDRLTQARIDKLLGDANKLNLRFLDPEMGNTLAKELDAAKQKAGGK